MPTMAKVESGWIEESGTQSSSPKWVAGIQAHLPPSGAHINRKLKLEIKLALKPRYGNVGCKPPRQCFNHGWLLYFHCFAVPWLRCLPLTSHQCYIDLKQSLGCTLIKIAFVTAHFLSYLIFCAIAMNSIIWYFVKTLISILLSSV